MSKMTSKRSNKDKSQYPNSSKNNVLHLCAAQRTTFRAGNLVPCLGHHKTPLQTDWNYAKSFTTEQDSIMNGINGSVPWFSHPAIVCIEPRRIAEFMKMSGKRKKYLREYSMPCPSNPMPRDSLRRRAHTVSYPLTFDEPRKRPSSLDYTKGSYDDSRVKIGVESSNCANGSSEISLLGSSRATFIRKSSKKIEKNNSHSGKCNDMFAGYSQMTRNESTYEVMYFPMTQERRKIEDDYLMMQPFMEKKWNSSPAVQLSVKTQSSPTLNEGSESTATTPSPLPLRGFLPYSYSISEESEELTQRLSNEKFFE